MSDHPDRRDPLEVVTTAVLEGLPAGRAMPDVLEVGAGAGVFAERFHAAYPHVAYLATDQSPRLVDLARERGVPTRLMAVQELLTPDESYDVVVAIWLLDHVPDLDRGLREIRRVLRPGGRLVAAIDADAHTAEVGEAALRQHFTDVRRDDVCTSDVLPDQDPRHVTILIATPR